MYELSGSIVPLITPFNESLEIDYEAVKYLVRWHESSSTSALILGGSTGEGTLLTLDEKIELLNYVINTLKTELPVWVGVSALRLPEIYQQLTHFANIGVQGAMISTPLYIKPTQEEIVAYYTNIADHSEISLLLYDVPARTGSTIKPETSCLLSHHENIIGIKDCQLTEEKIMIYQKANANFAVYGGCDQQLMDALSWGVDGVISVIGNYLPQVISLISVLVQSNQSEKAERLFKQILPLVSVLEKLPNPGAIKYILSKSHEIQPYLKKPLMVMDEASQATLDQALLSIEPIQELDAY